MAACDNRACPLHSIEMRHENIPYVDVDMSTPGLISNPSEPKNFVPMKRFTRHLYRNSYGNRTVYLCEVCHNAVEMCKR